MNKEKWNTGDLWVCEQHPDTLFPHNDCAGPGMPPTPKEHKLIKQALTQKDEELKKKIERLRKNTLGNRNTVADAEISSFNHALDKVLELLSGE